MTGSSVHHSCHSSHSPPCALGWRPAWMQPVYPQPPRQVCSSAPAPVAPYVPPPATERTRGLLHLRIESAGHPQKDRCGRDLADSAPRNNSALDGLGHRLHVVRAIASVRAMRSSSGRWSSSGRSRWLRCTESGGAFDGSIFGVKRGSKVGL